MNMQATDSMPKTLIDVVQYFSDPDRALWFLVGLKWPDGIVCHHCGTIDPSHTFLKNLKKWKCKACRKQFTAKEGTIFEKSQVSLSKWFITMWVLANDKNGVSSYEIHRGIGVTQKTAWFMLQRLRLVLQEEPSSDSKLSGIIEVDETYIGGKARNMHKDKREEKIKGRGATGKAIVMGLLERDGKIRTKVVGDTKRKTLHGEIEFHVEKGSEICSDSLDSYKGLDPEYVHNFVNHAETYVVGHVHTNGLENFWCLLKRTIGGTYTSCEPFHLFRYLDEQAFRFNYRKDDDAGRFSTAARSVVGKRLTYKRLIGEKPSGELPKKE